MGERRRTTSLAVFDDELAALVQAAAAAESDSDHDHEDETINSRNSNSNANANANINDEDRISALLQVLLSTKSSSCDEQYNATTESTIEVALLELHEYSAVALLHANALPTIAQYLQSNDATDTSIALLKHVVEEKCADLPYPHSIGPTRDLSVDFGITDTNALLKQFTRMLETKTSSASSQEIAMVSSILYCLFYFVAYGKVEMSTRKQTLHAILSSMQRHWQETELQYHGSRLLMAILDQDLSNIDILGSPAVKVLPSALKRVHAATKDDTGCGDDDPEASVFALRSLLLIIVGNDKAKQSFLASPWRAQVADICLSVIAVASYGTLLHCALNLLAVTIEDCQELQTMVVDSKHLPVLARLLKKYKTCQTLLTDLLRIFASVLHNDPVPGAGTKMVATIPGLLRTFFKVIAYCRRDSVRWQYTAKVASCVLIDMAFRNPLVCDEIVTHHYDNGRYSLLLVMPPYEAHWMQHVLAVGVTNPGARFLVTEEARADCHRFHSV